MTLTICAYIIIGLLVVLCILLINISKGIDAINKTQVFGFEALDGWMTSIVDVLYKDMEATPEELENKTVGDISKKFKEGEVLLDQLIEKSKNAEIE